MKGPLRRALPLLLPGRIPEVLAPSGASYRGLVRRGGGPVRWRGRTLLLGSERRASRRSWALARLLAFGTMAMCLSACRVDMTVRVESDEFGAGRIAVTADLDRDAAAAVVPQTSSSGSAATTAAVAGPVRIDDFRRAGWEGPGIVRKADGSARFSLFHRFTSVAEANTLLGQLSGPGGPLSDLRVTRNRSPWSTTISLSGPGDFRSGLSSLGDERLASITGNGAFGVSEAEVVRQAGGKSLDSVFSLRVDARLLRAERSWKLPSGASTPVALSSSTTSWATIAAAAAATLALLAFGALSFRSHRADAHESGLYDDADDDVDDDDDGASTGGKTSPAPATVDAVGPS